MTDIDWEKRLKQRKAAIDRAEKARDEDIAAAHDNGMPWRKIGRLLGINHERARQIGERIAKDTAAEHAPPA
jgi:hypothetical protein